MPVAKTFTIPEKIVEFLDSLPKREKSKFVSLALTKAILEKKKADALAMLDSIVPVESEKGSLQLLEESRKERLDCLLKKQDE
ncbi:MAG TPA: hypothetical protein ENJ44_08635 [Oceanospirillales bacterium]|nr:hypothetical protein [Oceanospirillales bacterium]